MNMAVMGALGPVFLLVVLGHLLGRAGFPGPGFWPQAERLTYYLLFPALLVGKVANAELSAAALLPVAGVLLALLAGGSLIALALARLLAVPRPQFSSFYQGVVRFNTYVGLASAEALFGSQGLVWGALFLALMIPAVNLACVGCFAWQNGSGGWRGVARGILTNPLILACLAGGLLNLSGVAIPSVVHRLLALLGSVALPLGLLAVGVGLELNALRRSGRALWGAALGKLVLYPALLWGLMQMAAIPAEAQPVLLLFALLPTAPSAYILARQLGGDAPLMAAIITQQTLLAMVTLPLAMMWLL